MRLKIPSRADKFIKDYRLPLFSTIGLVVILVLLLLLRTYERGILAGVLGNSASNGSDYARLLSKDKDTELSESESNSDDTQQTAAPNTSLTINSDGDVTDPSGGSNEPDPGGGGGTPPPPPPVEPFSAQIAGFGLRSQSGPFYCGNGGGSPSDMCMQYDFVAGVNTYDGPGTVEHELRWSGVSSDKIRGSFQAASGDAFTQVNNQVKLRCDKLGVYKFRFVLLVPSFVESHEIPINHTCGTVSP